MTGIVLAIGVLIVLAILYFILRATSLIDVFREADKKRVGISNKINGFLFPVFFVVGFALFIWYSLEARKDFLPEASSEHGIQTDGLFWLTMAILILVFIVTHVLLFFFPFRYQYKETTRASFYPDNNRLEILWTVIPAIVLSILIFTGWRAWSKITSEPPKESEEIEVMAFQFGWLTRYPGADRDLGAYNYKLIDPNSGNEWGLDMADKSTWDDFTPSDKILRLPKGKPVLFKIRARDVLHSVYAPHFRVKMDAVPGMPTRFWFIPTKSTKQMREELKNPNFNYELACAEVCGPGHFGMRMIIEVLEPEEYRKWYTSQATLFSKHAEWLAKVPENMKDEAKKLLPAEAQTTEGTKVDSTKQGNSDTRTATPADSASNLSATTVSTGDPKAGETIFKTYCTACHRVSDEQLVGPGLKNVHTRRTNEWIIKFVRNSTAFIKSGDKQANEVFNKFNKIMMPPHDLSDEQILSIVAYIKQESAK